MICSPVVRGGWVAVELELPRQVEGAVEQLVRRVRAATRKNSLRIKEARKGC